MPIPGEQENTGALGYHHHGPEPGQPERRSPDRHELAPYAHRAELEFVAPWECPGAPGKYTNRKNTLTPSAKAATYTGMNRTPTLQLLGGALRLRGLAVGF